MVAIKARRGAAGVDQRPPSPTIFSLLLDEWSMDGGILGGNEADFTAFLMDFNGISMKFQWDFNDLFMEHRIIGLGTCPILRVGKGWYTPI